MASAKIKIAFIEDDEADTFLFKSVCSGLPVDVNTYTSHKDIGGGYSAIFTDLNLNGRGLEVIDHLSSTCPGVPIIIVSGIGGPIMEDIKESYSALKGVSGYITKRDLSYTSIKKSLESLGLLES